MSDDEKKPSPDYMREHRLKQIDEIKQQQELFNKTEHELLTEERYRNFFEKYHPKSVENFIREYANQKAKWLQYGPEYVDFNEREDLRWINEALEHLGIIQQKKLFDAQCLWRAEKVTYPGVEICHDFLMWGEAPLYCPFIEPVNRDEVEMYMQYLGGENIDFELGWLEGWQDYEQLKEAHQTEEESRNYPEWYDFHSGRTGTGVYITLPDIRGEKEQVYANLARKEKQEENREKIEQWEQTREKRPWMPGVHQMDLTRYFVNTFEDKQTQEYFEAYTRGFRNRDEELELQEVIDDMLTSEEPVPIESHWDFREALYKAHHRFRARKIIEYLPETFEQYELKRQMNFQPSEEDLKSFKRYEDLRKNMYDMIIRGRILSGEPGDLNF